MTRVHPRRGTEVVIIHRKRYDDWTLPKGKVENGELLPATAVREVLEETGVTIRLNSPLDSVRYPTTSGLKAVDWWIGSAISVVRRAPDAEVDAVAWLPLRSAMSRLTFDHDHRLVEQCIAAADHDAVDLAAARQGHGPQGLVEVQEGLRRVR